MYVKKVTDATVEPVEAGSKTFRQVLISAAEGPHFAMRRFVIEPGGGMPTHTNAVEHEQYVLNGKAEIGIGEVEVAHLDRITLVVGPEGGISPAELASLEAAGARRVRLGAEILRTSTAGPAALAVLNARLGRW